MARRSARNSPSDRNAEGAGLSFAVRIGVELVAALIVGVGIGLLLDRWLGTAPWLLLLFFVLGASAGLLNVYRMTAGYGYGTGYRKPDEDTTDQPERTDRSDGR